MTVDGGAFSALTAAIVYVGQFALDHVPLAAVPTRECLVQEDLDVVQILLVGAHDVVRDLGLLPVKVVSRAARSPDQA